MGIYLNWLVIDDEYIHLFVACDEAVCWAARIFVVVWCHFGMANFVSGPRRTRQMRVHGRTIFIAHSMPAHPAVCWNERRERVKKRTKNWLALRWVWALMHASIRSIYSMAFEIGMAGWVPTRKAVIYIKALILNDGRAAARTAHESVLNPRLKAVRLNSTSFYFILLFSVQLITINVFESLFV